MNGPTMALYTFVDCDILGGMLPMAYTLVIQFEAHFEDCKSFQRLEDCGLRMLELEQSCSLVAVSESQYSVDWML